MTPLLPVAEAQARLLAMAAPLPAEAAGPEDWAGRWTSAAVHARRSQPAQPLSAMDGYAIRFADARGPWAVIGESPAGSGFDGPVGPGEAVRIFTGAPLPPGTDCIVPQEDVAREGRTARLTGNAPARAGAFVRLAGADFAEGQELIPAGTRLTARHVASAILGGHGTVPLPRKPRVALISNGAELVAPGSPAAPGQLPASNAAMLRAMLAPLPCRTDDRGLIDDDRAALIAALTQTDGADIVVTTGGASVGDHDLIRPALEAAGGHIEFWRIRMRPGKPLICGRLGKALFLGLPGNPVSAFVTAQVFLIPLIAAMAGARDPLPRLTDALLTEPLPANGARRDYMRATLHDGRVSIANKQDSSMLATLARADGLVIREPHAPPIAAGGRVAVLPIA